MYASIHENGRRLLGALPAVLVFCSLAAAQADGPQKTWESEWKEWYDKPWEQRQKEKKEWRHKNPAAVSRAQ